MHLFRTFAALTLTALALSCTQTAQQNDPSDSVTATGDGDGTMIVGDGDTAPDDPVVVNPDARLGRLARRRGWRIERW